MTDPISRNAWAKLRWALMLLFVPLLFAACADDEEEPLAPSHSDVVAIVQADVQAAIAELPEPEPGLTAAEVEEIVKNAVAAIPAPEPGLTEAQVEQIARDTAIAIPPRADAAAYTQFFVQSAIDRYEAEGLEATLDYYNSLESVDGPWYVFIIDADGTAIAHYDNERLGRNANDPQYSDINGFFYGPELLKATEDGKWVAYAFQNPGTGDINVGDYGEYELKNSWVVRHDDMVFGSGLYINADDMTRAFVQEAVDAYIIGGYDEIVRRLSDPNDAFSGGIAALQYYNNVDHIDGEFLAFTANPEGIIDLHSDGTNIGKHIDELTGGAELNFSRDGNWVSTEGTDVQTGNPVSTRLWGVDVEGTIITAGWRNDGTR